MRLALLGGNGLESTVQESEKLMNEYVYLISIFVALVPYPKNHSIKTYVVCIVHIGSIVS